MDNRQETAPVAHRSSGGAGVVAWRALLLAVGLFTLGVIALGAARPLASEPGPFVDISRYSRVDLALRSIWTWCGLYDGAGGRPLEPGGVTLVRVLPVWLAPAHFAVTGTVRMLGVALLASLVFHKLAFPFFVRSPLPRCRRCGYMLKGLSRPRCPECGLDI